MYIDDIRHYCISKKAVTESFPFNNTTLVFKVMNKIFLMAPLDKWEAGKASITVKCDPVYTDELRETFEQTDPILIPNQPQTDTKPNPQSL